MTEQPYVDPAHRVPDDEWAAVVQRAKEIREQTQAEAQGGASSGIAPVLDMTAKGIASRKYFPVSGIPTQLLVLHSAECPLAGGYAQSLTEWASSVYPSDPIASWQRFIDPLVRLRFIPDELGAWHASEANVLSIGWEQSGYARYTRDQWLTPDGLTQLESLAFDMAEVAVRDGIPARWLTDAEVTAATGGNRSIKGFCFHRQIDPETRTDPGSGYPADLLMQRIQFYMTGGTAVTVQSSTNTTPAQEWDEMASKDEIKDAIREVTKEGYGIVDSVWYRQINGWNGPVSAEARILGTDQAVNDIRALVAAQNAQIAGLVGALASVNKGEPFDEAKLLAGVQSAAETGVKEAIESITVTVKGGE